MVNGARRWLRVGPVNFQVSELAKVLVLTWVCSYCVRKRSELETTLPGFAKPVGLLTVTAFLLLLEPDFGAATVLFATGFAVLFVAGARLRYVLLLVVGGGAVVRGAGAHLGVSPEAPHRFPASLGRSLQRRLSIDAVADRHRPRRLVRRRSRQQRAEAVLSAGGAHRLRVRGARRGTGPGRRARRDRAVHGAGVAGVSDLAHGRAGGHALSSPIWRWPSACGWVCRPW